jgi:hypothetical protein
VVVTFVLHMKSCTSHGNMAGEGLSGRGTRRWQSAWDDCRVERGTWYLSRVGRKSGGQ